MSTVRTDSNSNFGREGQAWSRDDFVLVLDLYARRGRNVPRDDEEVRELAALLQRSPGSITRRLGNFAGTESAGARGLKPVTGLGLEVWTEFRERPDLLPMEGTAARDRLGRQGPKQSPQPEQHAAGGRGVRDQLADALRMELMGPVEEREALKERPSTRYVCGILWPEGTQIEPDQNEAQPPGDDEEDSSGFEESIPLVQTLNPSSIGVSVILEPGTEEISLKAQWGEYVREVGTPEGEEDEETSRALWRRAPVIADPLVISLRRHGAHRTPVSDDGRVSVEWLVRPLGQAIVLSVFLVNRRPRATSWLEREQRAIFQPALSIRAGDDRPVIIGRHPDLPIGGSGEPDEMAARLLFRDELEFAVGHGCAAAWERDGDRAAQVWTDLLPSMELPALVAQENVPGLELDMGELSRDHGPDELELLLRPLLDVYGSWIDQLEMRIPNLPEHMREQGASHMAGCREALERIAGGITLLKTDEASRRAFRLMNATMQLQRSHSDWAAEFRRTGIREGEAPPLLGRWRPFQLAFILVCLRGCAEADQEERRIADLLWFPTGGGKTEAYLGLAAFVALLRRLTYRASHHQGAGVCVLMRYTLRLLTVQQFQRAATLACALEIVRAREGDLGAEPFRVGIWVGGGTTPNTFDESDKALTRLIRGEGAEGSSLMDEGSPVQLVSCPWCGEQMMPRHYRALGVRRRTLAGCSRGACEFSFQSRGDGIPAVVVDEEIYRCLPTVIIGTVDKFARLPWKGEAQTLFGRVNRYCPRHGYLSPADDHPEGRHGARANLPAVTVSPTDQLPPPELIIQDELHLISGPLGSMVGLYEAGIDWLASRADNDSRIAPKVIASTATVRRAPDQVWGLFSRVVRVFPPPGLEHVDSFFARRASLVDMPGRVYMGVFAPGKSVKTAQVRVMALLLAAAQQAFDHSQADSDPYMTLVGYYNSLRELGGAVNLVRDDIRERLRVLAGRGWPERRAWEPEELTSRRSSRQIPRLLDRLAVPHAEREAGKRPVDVLLSTNMISVGVDILRLGLMVVVGQPKATAEYIQATSRVGRRAPGLIVTIYNWSRPRDLSHYERFRSYHSTLYRHVEATSVTPFSSRARDRGLHAIYVGMCRAGDFDLTPEGRAVAYSRDRAVASEALEVLSERAGAVGGPEVAEAVRRELVARQDVWEQLTGGGPLRYSWESLERLPPPGVAILLRQAGTDRNGVWSTPGSLREIEPQAGLYLQEDFS